MKRKVSILLMLVFCLMVLAQGKLTPELQMRVMRKKAMLERKAAEARDQGKSYSPSQKERLVTLVVRVAEKSDAETFRLIRSAGATVLSKLGRQFVISLPLDSVDALTKIEGIERIDVTHKGRRKTDVTREETGVSLVDGTTGGATTAFTGKGVTVCLVDAGFDYQHPAFKDAQGNSRIKCVYLMGDGNGNKFSVEDPEAGTIVFPGSVYDTPELIATLTTDMKDEYHGTHTAGIAAGSRSPLGFGGMAPEADLVLIPLDEVEIEGYEIEDDVDYIELALAFADAYAQQSQQPMVLSVSANSHYGPHDGTSSVTEAIESVSEHVIPVFSAGNEGGFPIHLYRQFTSANPSVSTILLGIMDDENGEFEYFTMADVVGYTRTGDEVSVQLTLCSINPINGKLNTVWTSEKCTATPGCEEMLSQVLSTDDPTLAKYFDGEVVVGAFDYGGRLAIHAMVLGGMDKLYLFKLTLSGSDGTEIDVWDEIFGFGGKDYLGLSGYVDGDNVMSAGDWTSTDRVVSVGAYCANVMCRDYDGQVTDTSVSDDPDEDVDVKSEIAWFSSFGTSLNGVVQPTVCAPGVNIVSSLNHYVVEGDAVAETMQWDGYPYGAESGTSMSCPVVSGIVALWLQANPTMNLDDVKEVLLNSSKTDSFTSANLERWGWGKVDAAKGIEYITTVMGVEDVICRQDTDNIGILYDLQGRRLSGNPSRGIYVQDGRKVVIK